MESKVDNAELIKQFNRFIQEREAFKQIMTEGKAKIKEMTKIMKMRDEESTMEKEELYWAFYWQACIDDKSGADRLGEGMYSRIGKNRIAEGENNKMLKIKVIIGVLLILMVGFILFMRMTHREDETLAVNLEVTSEAFGNDGLIPTKYTGKGEDLSPPLKFGEIDVEAKTIAVIMDDLDHPLGLYNHWVIWNIPASVNSFTGGNTKNRGCAVSWKCHTRKECLRRKALL